MESSKAKEKKPERRSRSRRALWLLLLLWLVSITFVGVVISDLYAEVGLLQTSHADTAGRLRDLERRLAQAATQEELEAIARELSALAQSVRDAQGGSAASAQPAGPGFERPAAAAESGAGAAGEEGSRSRPAVLEQIARAISNALRPRPALP